MRIGIVSDTHGDANRLSHALKIFSHHQVQAIVHCGDVGSIRCLRLLANAAPNVYVVAGNTDRHVDELADEAESLGINFAAEAVHVPLDDGKALVATHGHDENLLGELIADRQFHYVCHGHSHMIRDEGVNGVRVINPGALHRAKVHTVAVLDTVSGVLEHIVVR
jgi:putative phosphoesterase